jgi:molybdopterin-guanine dinucleotide biosynthesis protein B
MAKIMGVVGYKGSGKTTLTRALARELIDRGYRVAVVKHTSHRLDLPGKDSAVLGEAVDQVGIVSSRESAVFWKKPLSLEDLTSHLKADIILVEGFKSEKAHLKIVCLRGQPDDRDLFDDLTIAAVGPADQVQILELPLFDRDEIDRIADLVEQVEDEV